MQIRNCLVNKPVSQKAGQLLSKSPTPSPGKLQSPLTVVKDAPSDSVKINMYYYVSLCAIIVLLQPQWEVY